jgi:hypothetical protein
LGSFTAVQIATDAAGNVYLPNAPNNEVQEFDSSGTLLQTITGSGPNALSGPTGVAIDSSANVWVSDSANNRVEEFSSTGTFITEIAATGVQAVALDTSGHLFASVTDGSGSHVLEYTGAGAQIDDFGLGTIGTSGFATANALAVDNTSGDVLVADGANNVVWIFRQASPPSVSAEHATNVTADAATVGATINPGGPDTTFHVEYGTADCSSNPCTSIPIPDADAGSGFSDLAVSQHFQGLTADTTYHYRVLATNTEAPGGVSGPDRTFTTQGPGGSFALPDNRGYEQVTPADKGDGALYPTGLPPALGDFQASLTGDQLGYPSLTPFPGAQAGAEGYYLASRGAGGWSSQNTIPPQAPVDQQLESPAVVGLSSDLSKLALQDGGGNAGVGQDDPPLVPGEPPNNQNLFLRDNAGGSYQLANLTPPAATPDRAGFQGASADLSHLLFTSAAQLTPDALPNDTINLYQWAGGAVTLAGQIPPPGDTSCGGAGPACIPAPAGANLGSGRFAASTPPYAVSTDGSRVFFKDGVGFDFDRLYLRQNDTTTEVSASQKTNGSGPGGTDPNGPFAALYRTATPDGSKVLFTDCEQLTNDSTAGSSQCSKVFAQSGDSEAVGQTGDELYQYDTAAGQLTDLTVDSNGDPHGADVLGVLGQSADGSSAYFAANGVLAPGASLGDCQHAWSSAQPGRSCNLYLAHNGAITFIATVDNLDDTDWNPAEGYAARVTPDGTHLAFESLRSLTGYDNTIATSASRCSHGGRSGLAGDPRCQEVYLYDAQANGGNGQLACASCDPTGARPLGPSSLPTITKAGTTGSGGYQLFGRLKRNLSDDAAGLFFDSSDALVPGDINAAQDVYEYTGGRPHLISTGTSPADSQFIDASPSANDVFFETRSRLVGQDTDGQLDLYDARVGGGFPFAQPPPPCFGDSCKPPPSGSPPDQTPGSSGFSGPGNQGKNLGGSTTTSKKKCKHKKHKKHKKCHMSGQANTTGRAGR